MKKLKLTIELVPYDCFEQNLRHILSKGDWDKIRKETYKRYDYCCAICKASGVVLSAHEEWVYRVTNQDKKTGTQRLVKVLSLCNNCHMIKHICFADELARQGKLDMGALLEHFYRVNKCGEEEFITHYNQAVKDWNELVPIKFKINIKNIEKLGLELDSYPVKKTS